MIVIVRRALFALALAGAGCAPTTPLHSVDAIQETRAPTVAPAPAIAAENVSAESRAESRATPTAATPAGEARLEKVKYDEFLSRIAANKGAKYTMVDTWATWCGPCKENFPHVVEMNKKYGDKGLAVVSLSFDDPTNTKQVDEAKQFLAEKKAVFTNFLLDEDEGVGFEKLDILAIPAVFLYGPDGKEVRRFTMDDPNNQFTYDEVEKVVAGLLAAK